MMTTTYGTSEWLRCEGNMLTKVGMAILWYAHKQKNRKILVGKGLLVKQFCLVMQKKKFRVFHFFQVLDIDQKCMKVYNGVGD